MANAGFNAATDLFNMGAAWKVKSSNINKSASTAECPNNMGDITHRDVYAERIAPSAEYELAADVTTLPALGTVVTIDTMKVAIESISIKTGAGQPVTATVTGKQVQSSATNKRTYSVGTIALSARHRAQDVIKALGNTMPATVTESTFTFSADVTVSEPKGNIESHDVSNGKVVASYTHTCGTNTTISAPTVSGMDAVVSQPVTKSHPENGYITVEFGVTKSLTGTDAAAA